MKESEGTLKELRSLVVENKDNRKEINILFEKYHQQLRDEIMMKKIKMEYVGFKV